MYFATPGIDNTIPYSLDAKTGAPITTGTVNAYLVAMNGVNAGKWWIDATSSWAVTEAIALTATVKGTKGLWTVTVKAAAWVEGTAYSLSLVESGDLDIRYSKDIFCTAFPATVIANLDAAVTSRATAATAATAVLAALGGPGFDIATDGLEAIRNRGDVAWITGAGGDATLANQTAIAGAIAGLPVPGDATAANQATILARLGSIAGSGANTVLGYFKALFSTAAATPSDLGGTATAAAHSNQAIRERGDAAWTTGGVTGACHITITVKETDAGGDPVPDLRVDLRADGGSSTLDSRTTDENGVIDAYLDPGVYDVYLRQLGTYSAQNVPENITVAADGDAFELYVDPFDPGAIATEDTCTVFVGELEPDNDLPTDTIMRARPIHKDAFTASNNLVAFKEVSANVEDGVLQISLLREMNYFITVGTANAPERDFSGARHVPNEASKGLNLLGASEA